MALTSKQEQHAGNASNQYQANQIVVNNGLSEEQAIKVFQSMIPIALASYEDMAAGVAEERINRFKGKLLPRLEKIEGAFENFKDPAFQMQLRRAQISAAVSDQESDWDMLSQLMIKHIEIKKDRNKKLGVTRAIEIIGEIDNQALLALTVLYAFLYLMPMEGNINRGLDILEELYSKILYQELPKNDTWIDHLEILKTIKTSVLVSLETDEVASVEYWLYLEGCDEQCFNPVQNKDAGLMLAFVGVDESQKGGAK